MPSALFNIPNEGDAAYGDQAEPDSLDFKIICDAFAGTSVQLGAAVAAKGSPDGTVDIGTGTVRIEGNAVTVNAGTDVSVISGSANLDGSTATAADGSLPRFSLVVCNDSGNTGVIHGTAAANAVFPTWAITQVVLAAIYVPALATTVTTSHIVDKRILTDVDALHNQAHSLSGANHTNSINVAGGLGKSQQLTGVANATNYVGALTSGTAPVSGTFAVGDFVVVHTGGVSVCTVAGTPGTWTAVSGGAGGGATFLSATKWGVT